MCSHRWGGGSWKPPSSKYIHLILNTFQLFSRRHYTRHNETSGSYTLGRWPRYLYFGRKRRKIREHNFTNFKAKLQFGSNSSQFCGVQNFSYARFGWGSRTNVLKRLPDICHKYFISSSKKMHKLPKMVKNSYESPKIAKKRQKIGVNSTQLN